nr:hypothetical protein [Butyrivibrio sp. AE3009]
MGLFIDGDGIPLAFSILGGNQNEQKSLKPLESKSFSSSVMISLFTVAMPALVQPIIANLTT